MTAILSLALADARALGRDPLLRLLLVAPLGLTGVLLVGVPLVEGWAAGTVGVDLGAYRPLVVAFIVCVTMPLFLGAMAGLLVLEDRESGVLPAIAVSPAGIRSYLVVRCGWSAAATAVTIGGALGLHGGIAPAVVGVVAGLGGGYAVVVLLLVGALAVDRLEGMVVVKTLTLPLALVLAVDAVAPPFPWLLALLPSHGAAVTFLHASDGRPIAVVALVGVATTALWIGLLLRRFLHRLG